MKKANLIVAAAVLFLLSSLLQREFTRGTFDPVERAFVAWLSANSNAKAAMPPLTLVLYDDEASALAGASRMGALDVTLFARAVSRLGAVAGGVEGMPGDPSRMMEAAGGMPVFAGYAPETPPGAGWTPWGGVPGARWLELRGVPGPAATRLPRGFFSAPEGDSGPCRVALSGRIADRIVPSFLALTWAAGSGLRSTIPVADGGWLKCGPRSLPLDPEGGASFFAADPARVLSMNELLVAAEKYERREEASPLRGHVVVLARATADIARLRNSPGGAAATPSELWARSWDALGKGRFFVLPGWWYQPLLAAIAVGLALGPGRRGWSACLGAGAAALLVYLLAAIGVFSSFGLLLPFVPTAGTLAAGVLSGRFIFRS